MTSGMCLVDRPGVVPTGLDSILIAIDPTLKRGANKHCASGAAMPSVVQIDPTLKRGANKRWAHGADDRLVLALSASMLALLRGHPPALPEGTYSQKTRTLA